MTFGGGFGTFHSLSGFGGLVECVSQRMDETYYYNLISIFRIYSPLSILFIW